MENYSFEKKFPIFSQFGTSHLGSAYNVHVHTLPKQVSVCILETASLFLTHSGNDICFRDIYIYGCPHDKLLSKQQCFIPILLQQINLVRPQGNSNSQQINFTLSFMSNAVESKKCPLHNANLSVTNLIRVIVTRVIYFNVQPFICILKPRGKRCSRDQRV